MDVVVWGVRGSIPNPNQDNRFYGSNTTCIEVRPTPELLLVFDAGTGIRSLSKTLPASGECHIFISHAHSDHVQGLSFFAPFFSPDWTINIHLPHYLHNLPYQLFDGNSFPVSFLNLSAKVNILPLEPEASVTLESNGKTVRVDAFTAHHPGGGYAYKVSAPNASFLYSGDHEITGDTSVLAETQRMLKGVNTAIVDATYTKADYHKGWGHSAWEDWVDMAEEAGVDTLVLSHHMPDRADMELDALQRSLLARKTPDGAKPMQVAVAREGMHLTMPDPVELDLKCSNWLEDFIDSLTAFREETALLDRILSKTRELANADAGFIYLVDGNELAFAYAQNNTLYQKNTRNRSMYETIRLPIQETSMAGYVAATGKPLNIPNVRAIPPTMPFTFNDAYDRKTGYVTTSMLTLPIGSPDYKILGVLQLVNSLNPRTREVAPFPDSLAETVRVLAREAAAHMEASRQIHQSVNRLLYIAELHDPSETIAHAERVGAIASEVYHHWAEEKAIAPEHLRSFKSQLRLAAMLHDVGKAGMCAPVVATPHQTAAGDCAAMQNHTTLGAELLRTDSRDIVEMAHEISLHHHQKWNGTGYPAVNGMPPSGMDIPLSARITAIADAFDSLVSPHGCKDALPLAQAAAVVRDKAGEAFDPDLVAHFLAILDTVGMIYQRYPEAPLPAPEAAPAEAAPAVTPPVVATPVVPEAAPVAASPVAASPAVPEQTLPGTAFAPPQGG